MQTYQGSCHCGAVRFEVDADIQRVTVCNCSICSKKGAMHHRVGASAFRVTAGGDDLVEYRFGTRTAQHLFCRHCGMHPFSHPRLDPSMVSVNVRCLDRFEEIVAKATVAEFDGRHWEQAAAR